MPTRHEIVTQHLAPYLQARPRVLEIGAGDGLIAQMLHRATGAEFTLLDVVDYNQSAFPMKIYDGKALPFADDAFDLAMLVYVLHHNPDPRPVMQEALRVSKQGALVVENDVHGILRKHATRLIDSAEHVRRGVPPCYFTKSAEEWSQYFTQFPAQVETLTRFKIGWFWNNIVLRVTHPMPH